MTATTASRPRRPMTLWRLEIARLVRTNRWLVLLGLYGFFGITGPLLARYMNELFERMASVTIIAPDPTPADGIVQYIGNASQIGLLALVVVAALALAVDTKPELAAFLRTKVDRVATLILPRFTITAATAVVALLVGTSLAWALTAALIGALPTGPLLLGTLYGAIYQVFVVAVVAAVAGFARSQAAIVLASLGALLVLPVVAAVPALRPWLPSELLGAVVELVQGAPADDFLRSALVTVAATGALLVLAARGFDRREL